MTDFNNHEHPVEQASTTEALPMSPSLGPGMQAAGMPFRRSLVDGRVLFISMLSVLLAVAAAFVAKALVVLIGLITGVSFFGTLSPVFTAPVGNHLGWWIVFIPVAGGIIVGLMARYGSAGIRGHGIPEAMERVLRHESRVPARLTFLKPLSAAIAIGTGGPFGAEGPIIATGGALGSLIGQVLSVTAIERKTLLAAGAAAGMAAIFGTPVSAVLLAVELLLFEFRPRTFIPVALAATVAAGTRLHPPHDLPRFPIARAAAAPRCPRSRFICSSARSWGPPQSSSPAAFTRLKTSSTSSPFTGCGGLPSARSRLGSSATARRARWASVMKTSAICSCRA